MAIATPEAFTADPILSYCCPRTTSRTAFNAPVEEEPTGADHAKEFLMTTARRSLNKVLEGILAHSKRTLLQVHLSSVCYATHAHAQEPERSLTKKIPSPARSPRTRIRRTRTARGTNPRKRERRRATRLQCIVLGGQSMYYSFHSSEATRVQKRARRITRHRRTSLFRQTRFSGRPRLSSVCVSRTCSGLMGPLRWTICSRDRLLAC